MLHAILLGTALLASAANHPTEAAQIHWQDARELVIEGQPWGGTPGPFDRLPQRVKGLVRPAVWTLGRDSTGLAIRFVTDAKRIDVRWTLRSEELDLPHMAATGVSGVDLYVRSDDAWRWLAAGRPIAFPENETTLVSGMDAGQREYILYLPLYNGVEALELGVPEGALLERPAWSKELPAGGRRPIVFYGTSITQGASASRPGSCHVALLGRWLDVPVVNLGFSGEGKMDIEMAELLGEIDAAAYVLDCLPNMRADLVRVRYEPFLQMLREYRPDTPVLLVEDRTYGDAFLRHESRERNRTSRKAMREVFEEIQEKLGPLYYLEGDGLLGNDGEALVDGSHPNDLGFFRLAQTLRPVLEEMLGKN